MPLSDIHSEACIPIYANRTVKSIMSTPFKTLESLFIYSHLFDPEAIHFWLSNNDSAFDAAGDKKLKSE